MINGIIDCLAGLWVKQARALLTLYPASGPILPLRSSCCHIVGLLGRKLYCSSRIDIVFAFSNDFAELFDKSFKNPPGTWEKHNRTITSWIAARATVFKQRCY